MTQTYIVTGTLTDEHTVRLDKNLPLSNGKVRLVVQPVGEAKKQSLQKVLNKIHDRQQKRGHTSPTKTQVDDYVHRERENWD